MTTEAIIISPEEIAKYRTELADNPDAIALVKFSNSLPLILSP
ncbi:MAG TPA: hypothetical protein V6C58_25995 [Allocoleopsis sp.]